MARYKPEIWFDLSDVIGEMKLHDVSIGYDGNVYVLASTKGFIRHYDNRNWFRTKQPIDYIVFIIDGERQISSFSIPVQSFIYSDVQPLPNEEILLATARSVFRSTSDYDLNGKVFTKDGVLQREFLLGDGIQTVQTTSTGMIWTSYFDEGTMGNYGWGFGTGKTTPIGANGLLKWDSFGNIKWEFDAEKLKLPPIVDCYALNVIDDDTVWIYYYSNFPIVRLKNDKVDVFWRSPIRWHTTYDYRAKLYNVL